MKDYSSESINWPVQGNFVGASPVNALGYDAGWQQFKEASPEASGEEVPSAGSEPPGEGAE